MFDKNSNINTGDINNSSINQIGNNYTEQKNPFNLKNVIAIISLFLLGSIIFLYLTGLLDKDSFMNILNVLTKA